MSRRSANPGTAAVQLFPFLAVLLCTMGALVVVWVVIGRHARAEAVRAAQARQAARADQEQALQGELDVLRFRAAQLAAARDKTAEQLQDARLELSTVEDHLRRLREQVDQITAQARALQRAERPTASSSDELSRLREQLAALRAEIARREAAAREQKPKFAVVPYDGKHGTRRRPIYIECRIDAILLQPEGIAFSADDFQGPPGPSNPLAAAVRAAREFYQEATSTAEGAEPYPFLLVRPDGVVAYAEARAALESWGNDFGYELVDDDWQIEYPPADPRLADKLKLVAQQARAAQRRLIAAAPREYRGLARANRGGVPRGRFVAVDPSDQPLGEGGIGSPLAGGQGLSGAGGGGGNDRRGKASEKGAGGTDEGAGDRAARGAGKAQAGTSSAEESGRGESSGPSGGSPNGPAGASPGGVAAVSSLAAARGADWGLPPGARGSYPVTRPLLVRVLPDRLIVAPEGNQAEQVIRLAPRTQDSVDQLVATVWKQVKEWGIAGKGLYWKPTLVMDVGPAAEARFAELQALLSDSGLEVARRGGATTAAQPSAARDSRRR